MERRDSVPPHALSDDGKRDLENDRDARTGQLDGRVESLPTDQVELTGQRKEADLIIQGLRLLRGELQMRRILSKPPSHPLPDMSDIDNLISSIEQPRFPADVKREAQSACANSSAS